MPFPINGFNKIFMRNPFLIAFLLIVSACSQAPESGQKAVETDGYRFMRLEAEKLPSLNQPRGGHVVAYLNGELTVFGGHTDGFIPLKTAEYLSGGRWIEVPMLYTHDNGFAVCLPDGKIMQGGGSSGDFGIGQSWGTEIYDPKTHSFTASGILNIKRAGASALALPDGRIIVAGNWWTDDDIEIYSPEKVFSPLKPASRHRTHPYILQTDSAQAIVFSSLGVNGDTLDGCVDRVWGEAFSVPLLEEWASFSPQSLFLPKDISISDHTYLICATRKANGQTGIIKVSGEDFSLLNMEKNLPKTGIEGETIKWGWKIKIDHQARNAYILGCSTKRIIYIAEISYDATLVGENAGLALYYTDALKDFSLSDDTWELMEDGKIALAGGLCNSPTEMAADNFKTNSCVFVFNTKPVAKSRAPFWIIAAGAIAVIGIIALLYALLRKKPEEKEKENNPAARKPDPKLEEQISRLIEEKELFKKKDLRIGDIASELATNRTYISFIVNSSLGTNFSDLINGYRIKYAQMLMTEHPEMSHTDVAEESGFSSRTSFLRTFKAKTGMTPTEWKESNSAS